MFDLVMSYLYGAFELGSLIITSVGDATGALVDWFPAAAISGFYTGVLATAVLVLLCLYFRDRRDPTQLSRSRAWLESRYVNDDARRQRADLFAARRIREWQAKSEGAGRPVSASEFGSSSRPSLRVIRGGRG